MRVLIVNEFIEMGGAEMIVAEQQRLFRKKGIKVKCLYFNKGTAKESCEDKYYYIPVKSKVNKVIFNCSVYYRIRKVLKEYCPDCIIIHNLFSSPVTQYFAFRKYKVIQLVHDYSVVCPTSFCVNQFGICKGYKRGICNKNCKYHNSKLLLKIKKIELKFVELLRKKYVSICISPSDMLKQYLLDYGYNALCINNYVSFPKWNIEKKKKGKIRYVYFGGLTKQKGILEFLKIFSEIIQEKNIEFDLYGSYSEIKYKQEVEAYLSEKIKYHGKVTHDIVINEIIKSDYVVVPSMWMENFPTIILEAMSLKTVVIGSDRGGIPEMLNDGRGLVFKYGDVQSVCKIIESSWNLTQLQYDLIVKKASEYYQTISDEKSYVNKWIKLMK